MNNVAMFVGAGFLLLSPWAPSPFEFNVIGLLLLNLGKD